MQALLKVCPAESIAAILSRFKCSRDTDVENFLRNKAVAFEQRNLSRTYLIADEEAYFPAREIKILGYFSVAIHVLSFSEAISKNRRQKLSGGDKNVQIMPSFLIGQLGKNDDFKDAIAGSDLLRHALSMIRTPWEFVGGRLIVVECKPEPKLHKFYGDYKFKFLDHNPANDLDRFYLKLK